MNLEDIHGITKHLQPAPVPARNPWNNASKKLSISKKNDLINDQNNNNIKAKKFFRDKENIEITDEKGIFEEKKKNSTSTKVQIDSNLKKFDESVEERINNSNIKFNNNNNNNNNDNCVEQYAIAENKNVKKKGRSNSKNERRYSVDNLPSIVPIPSPNSNSQSFYMKTSPNRNRRLSSSSINTPKSLQFEFTNLNNNLNNFNNFSSINFNSTFNPYIRNGYYHPIMEQNRYQQLSIQPRVYYNNQINYRGHIQPYFPMMIPNGIPIPMNMGYNNNNNYQFRNDNFYYGNISPTVQTPYNGTYNGDFSDEEEKKEEEEIYEFEKDEYRENFNQLINQIKYYFSVENLCKDLYLRNQMDNEGFIPISLIKNFSRVKNLSNGENDKVDLAIENIKELEKKGDKLRIREGWDKWILKKRI